MLHRRICKFALGLPTSTTNVAVYGDLGRVPLSIRHKVSLLKYWLRITTSTDISPLLLEAYQLLTLNDHPNTWCRKIQRILNEAGFSYVWSNPCEVDLSRKFWSGENFGPGDQNSRKIGPPGPLFPENLGPAVE